jgi:hypothetical protein
VKTWPALTLLGITCAVLIGIAHAAALELRSCLLGYDDLHLAPLDPFGPDGYGPP